MSIDWADDYDGLGDEAEDQRLRWFEKWAPRCPIGNPQRVRAALAYREREPGRLQLRVPLGGTEGVCHVVVDEREDAVHVRVIVCRKDTDEDWQDLEYVNCPVRAYLEGPVAGRPVIDVQGGRSLPLFVPDW